MKRPDGEHSLKIHGSGNIVHEPFKEYSAPMASFWSEPGLRQVLTSVSHLPSVREIPSDFSSAETLISTYRVIDVI